MHYLLLLLLSTVTVCCAQKEASRTTVATTDTSLHSTKSAISLVDSNGTTIASRFRPPAGARRIPIDRISFGHYLRNHPLLPATTPVRLYNGKLKSNQTAHAAVLNISIGQRDLQQCADAVMRLRAEYLWEQERFSDIGFHFTNGFLADYRTWRQGKRIIVEGNDVSWTTNGTADSSYPAFNRYLQMVFAYAGTLSLTKELEPRNPTEMQIGDVFIQGGSPGHAVIVVDMARNEETGVTYFMLAQSYMPAQNIHVLKNPIDGAFSPWFNLNTKTTILSTPEWTFNWDDLRAFE